MPVACQAPDSSTPLLMTKSTLSESTGRSSASPARTSTWAKPSARADARARSAMGSVMSMPIAWPPRSDGARREHQVHAGAAPDVNHGRACWERGHPKRVCDACKRSGRLGGECGECGGVVSESLSGIGGTTMKVELARGITSPPARRWLESRVEVWRCRDRRGM